MSEKTFLFAPVTFAFQLIMAPPLEKGEAARGRRHLNYRHGNANSGRQGDANEDNHRLEDDYDPSHRLPNLHKRPTASRPFQILFQPQKKRAAHSHLSVVVCGPEVRRQHI